MTATSAAAGAGTCSCQSSIVLTRFKLVGVCCSKHAKFSTVAVVIFATHFDVKPPSPRKQLPQEDSSDEADDWPTSAVSMKEKKTEAIKDGKKVVHTVRTYKLADGNTVKRETTECTKLN